MIPVSALLLGPFVAADANVYVGTERNLRVEIPRIETTVQVDGRLSEPVWQLAARLIGFSQ